MFLKIQKTHNKSKYVDVILVHVLHTNIHVNDHVCAYVGLRSMLEVPNAETMVQIKSLSDEPH